MKRRDLGFSLLLVLAVALVYSRVAGFPFVLYDDDDYVSDNPHVYGGLTLAAIRWAFTEFHVANWHPLTWLSHMLDVELYGLWAGGHHVTNVALHALNGVLLFAFLRVTTRTFWPAALVALLFCVHPLRVESVAWISERKDVLSSFFWIATMLAYAAYAEHRSVPRYILVTLLFFGGLLSKPMVVTLPFVLLLLDLWPLERWPGTERLGRLCLEKVPWILSSAASAIATFIFQSSDEAVSSLHAIPLPVRVFNSVATYGQYLADTLWPVGLNVINLHPGNLLPEDIAALRTKALLVAVPLVLITFFAVRTLRRRPYFFVGWFWYLGTLVPVVGLVQVGYQSHADRYTYLPLVGVYLALVWSLREALLARPGWAPVARGAGAAACLVLGSVARYQVGFWRDTETLFLRSIAIEGRNYVAHYQLGRARVESGDYGGAVESYQAALAIDPNYQQAYNGLGFVFSEQGRLDEAERMLRRCLAVDPEHVQAISNLGLVHVRRGEMEEGRKRFERALELDPELAEAHNNLGGVYATGGEWDLAETHFRRAAQLKPDYAEALNNLGLVHQEKGRFDQARASFGRALAVEPGFVRALENLGILAQGQGNWGEAIRFYRMALETQPSVSIASAVAWLLATVPDETLRDGDLALSWAQFAVQNAQPAEAATALNALAAALAEKGRSSEAAAAQERALGLVAPRRRAEFERRLNLYRSGGRARQ